MRLMVGDTLHIMQTEDKKVGNAAVSVVAFERPMSVVRTASFTGGIAGSKSNI